MQTSALNCVHPSRCICLNRAHISLPHLWIFFLVPVYIFFFSLFLCCPRDFLHGFYFVGILWVFFTLFFLVPVSLFLPSFCVTRGIFPLFLGCRLCVGFLYPIFVFIVFILVPVKIFLSLIFVLMEGFWTLFLICHFFGFLYPI